MSGPANTGPKPWWSTGDWVYSQARFFPDDCFETAPKDHPVHCCPVCLGRVLRLVEGHELLVCAHCLPDDIEGIRFVETIHAKRPSASDFARALHSPDPEVRRSAARRLRCHKAGLKAAEVNRARG